METVICNLCGADQGPTLYTGYDRLMGVPGEFTLIRCDRCGLIYLNPRPSLEEIGAYYPEDYLPYLPAIEDEPSGFVRLDRHLGLNKRCRAVVRRAGRSGRLLDVGCATGVFLDGMRRLGWQAQGVELSPQASAYARQRFALEVFTGTLEQAHFPDGHFDLVTLWDVLEHVYDPKGTLQEVSRILRPGGWLALSLPDPDCIEAKGFGRHWAGWDMPRHLHVFSKPVLARLLAVAGFAEVDRSHFMGRYGVLVLNMQFWSGERVSNPTLRRALMAIVRSLPVRLLSLPYYAVADPLHQSSVVTVFARKQNHD